MNVRVSRRVWLSIGATAGLLALVWVVGAALAEGLGPEGEATVEGHVSLASAVAGKINYQGRLTDPGGTPLDGTFPMRFRVYDDPGAGTMLWDSGAMSVNVDNGLFNVELAVDPADFDGQALWLQMYVDFETLSPRQELVPVPYALSLRPGAWIKGYPPSTCSAVLNVEMDGVNSCGKAVWGSAATGSAIWGESAGGWGVRGFTEDGYAVYGTDGGTTPGRGYGGYFTSSNGVPLGGYSTAQRSWDNNHAAGIYGNSENGVGVVGWGESSSGWGIGVFGYGYGGAGGRFMTYNGNIIEGWEDVNGDGFVLEPRFRVEYDGDVYADRAYHCGLNDGGNASYIDENTGCMYDNDPADFAEMLPVANDPEPDDVLVIRSDGRLDRSTEPYQSTVAGVYSARPSYIGNAAKWGQDGYAPLAVVGLVRVKASAENGPIQPGDLLATSSTAGHAMKAVDPQIGTILGKALEGLDEGTGVILVLVTLH